MKEDQRAIRLIRSLERLTGVRAIRSGLVNIIPVLIIGAFSLILQTLPLPGWSDLIQRAAGGFFYQLLQLVYGATFGVLSLHMTLSISRSFMKLKDDSQIAGAMICAALCFFILAGADLPGFGTDSMGPKSMFLAILTGLGASALYLLFSRFFRRRRRDLFSAGANREFNRMLATIFPLALTGIVFAILNELVVRLSGMDSFRSLLAAAFDALFSHGEVGFFKGFCFVLLSSLLWFFGIHGSDTLEGAMQTYFAPGLAANQAAVAAGELPSRILTKEFFDCFVLMGGCGATICLLLAILLFSRNRARRGLGFTAAFPMIFNINELMVFGLPIIFNPIMLVPFLAVPLVCYSVAYLALTLGLVPLITSEVAWTTPILLGGLRATGSLAGSALQLVNVILGVLIYLPFVRLLDRQTEENARRDLDAFMEYFRANEQELSGVRLTELSNVHGDFAKGLCADLRHDMERRLILAYQPQYAYDGRCIGVEALLRWKHPTLGIIYPPLVVKLAEEGGFLPELEETVVRMALTDRPAVLERFGKDVHISVNITGTTIVTPRFLQYMRELNARDPFAGKNLCLEVTEQAAISFHEDTLRALRSLREMGLMLAIDDFSMGQTSLHYLKDELFDILKLDGSLIRGLDTHASYREIVSSVLQLAAGLNLTVIAEYVETEHQREVLHEMGCDNYQGWLYSPAVFL